MEVFKKENPMVHSILDRGVDPLLSGNPTLVGSEKEDGRRNPDETTFSPEISGVHQWKERNRRGSKEP
jgi:hypothetical protein